MSHAEGLEGLLPLDKPVGPTSHDMVAYARRQLGIRRIGHTGTLDPFASGLLLLCLGRATRLAEYLLGLPKEYVAVARLGERSTTDDVEGEVTSVSDGWTGLGSNDVTAALRSFEGSLQQRPPVYSAKKLGGTAAYKRARRGEEVALDPVPVCVHAVELEDLELPHIRFRISCSAGTYVRAIARDLGERLGVGAHLVELRRTSIGPFEVENALSPARLAEPRAVEDALVPPLEAVSHLPRIDVTAEQAHLLETGRGLALEHDPAPSSDGEWAVALDGRLVAVAIREGDRLRPRKVFVEEASND